MAQLEVRRRAMAVDEAAIPDKLYFRIGEVAALCGLPAYVLRFWESEFPQLKPNKGGTGQRLYRQRDVRIVFRIQELLYQGGFTIPGARQALAAEQRKHEPQLALAIGEGEDGHRVDRTELRQLRREMVELLEMLGGGSPGSNAKVRPIRPVRNRTELAGTTVDTIVDTPDTRPVATPMATARDLFE